jgi:hypothetical protein
MSTEVPIKISIDAKESASGKAKVIADLKDIKQHAANLNQQTSTLGGMFKSAWAAGQVGLNSLGSAFKTMGANLNSLKNQIFSLKTAFLGLGVGLLAKSFLDAADTTEQVRVRLETLLGSVQRGNALFKELNELAQRLPQTYEEIMQSATTLSTVLGNDVKQITKWTEVTADLASAFGMDMQTASSQMQRALSAGASAADTFREKGVNAFLGFTAGVQYSAEETKKKILDAWEDTNSRFRGTTARLASTWSGITSMLEDKWFAFRNRLMESAPFDFIKGMFSLINDSLGANADDMNEKADWLGKAIVEKFKSMAVGVAAAIDALKPAFDAFSNVFSGLLTLWNTLPSFMQELGIVGGALFGKKGLAVIAGFEASRKAGAFLVTQAMKATGELDSRSVVTPEVEEYMKSKGTPLNTNFTPIDFEAAKNNVRNMSFGGNSEPTNYTSKVKDALAEIDKRAAGYAATRQTGKTGPDTAINLPPAGAGNNAEATKQLKTYKDYIGSIKEEIAVMKDANSDKTISIEYLRQESELRQKLGRELLPKEKEELKGLFDQKEQLEKSREQVRQWGQDLQDVFSKIRQRGKLEWSDLTDFILLQLQRQADAQMQTMINGGGSGGGGSFFSNIFSSFFGGNSGTNLSPGAGSLSAGATDLGTSMPWLASAKGNAFTASGHVTAFANGGVVSSPTMFSYGGGKKGLMGEAGDEGILPLKRNSGGVLGVQAVGGSGNNGTTVEIYDQRGSGAPVQTQQNQNSDGSKQIKVFIRDAVKEGITNGAFDKPLNTSFGLNRKGM